MRAALKMNRCMALLFVSIIVLASVFVSGCTSQSNQTSTSTVAAVNQTSTITATTVDQMLNTMVEKLHDILAESSTAMTAWKVTWIDR
jgi:PBP1b-binding outer membrane lipoprotein LpoB